MALASAKESAQPVKPVQNTVCDGVCGTAGVEMRVVRVMGERENPAFLKEVV